MIFQLLSSSFLTKDIKNHPFTKSLDWEHIREIEAPFIPNPEDGLDTSYFDARNKAHQIDLQEVDRETPMHSDKPTFETSPKQEEDQEFENFMFKNVAGLENLNVTLDLP
ncbi:hypothetical protein HMI55_002632 [Coelomomyces lativittatus]|nr:hypothetical protein HMI55_002632 [Coelomomyces lativittatus]